MLEEHLWQVPNGTEKEVIGKTVTRDCNRSLSVFALLAVIGVLGIVVGIREAFFAEERDFELFFLSLILAPILGVLLVNNLVLVRYIQKVKKGLFKLRRVEILSKEPGSYGSNSFYAVVRPVDEESDTAKIVIEKGLFDRIRIGSIGRFVKIDDERVRRLCSPYWFIADTDYAVSPGAEGTDTGIYRAFDEPSEDIHQDMLARFNRENKNAYIRTVACMLIFLAGGTLIGLGAFPEDLSKELTLTLVLGGMFVCAIAVVILSFDHTRMIYSGRNGAMIAWTMWIVLNLFGCAVISIMPMPTALRITILIVMLLFNFASVFFAQRDMYFTLRELRAKRYLVSMVMVVSTEIDRTKQFMPYGYTDYLLVVKDQNDQTFEVKVSKKQYQRSYTNEKGLIAILERRPAVRIFKETDL